jgi:hypothetical protein
MRWTLEHALPGRHSQHEKDTGHRLNTGLVERVQGLHDR